MWVRRATLPQLSSGLATGVVTTVAVGYLIHADPHRRDLLFPPCLFRLLTGWNCPACGGLRMTYDVLHGNLAAAAADNIFLLVGAPMLLAYAVVGRRSGGSGRSAWLMAAAAVTVWTILRNLPGFPLTPTLLLG